MLSATIIRWPHRASKPGRPPLAGACQASGAARARDAAGAGTGGVPTPPHRHGPFVPSNSSSGGRQSSKTAGPPNQRPSDSVATAPPRPRPKNKKKAPPAPAVDRSKASNRCRQRVVSDTAVCADVCVCSRSVLGQCPLYLSTYMSTYPQCCYGCGAKLQVEVPTGPGYVPPAKYELKARHKQLNKVWVPTRCVHTSTHHTMRHTRLHVSHTLTKLWSSCWIRCSSDGCHAAALRRAAQLH